MDQPPAAPVTPVVSSLARRPTSRPPRPAFCPPDNRRAELLPPPRAAFLLVLMRPTQLPLPPITGERRRAPGDSFQAAPSRRPPRLPKSGTARTAMCSANPGSLSSRAHRPQAPVKRRDRDLGAGQWGAGRLTNSRPDQPKRHWACSPGGTRCRRPHGEASLLGERAVGPFVRRGLGP